MTDYNSNVTDAIAGAFALVASVQPSSVDVTVSPASVLISVRILVATPAAATLVQDALIANVSTPTAANALLSSIGGVGVGIGVGVLSNVGVVGIGIGVGVGVGVSVGDGVDGGSVGGASVDVGVGVGVSVGVVGSVDGVVVVVIAVVDVIVGSASLPLSS